MGGDSGLGVVWRGPEQVAEAEYRVTIWREFHRSRVPDDEDTPGLWDSKGKLTVESWTLDLRDEELELELSDGRRLPIHLIWLRGRTGEFHISSGEAIESFLGES